MNVKELKQKLNNYPDDMDVFIHSTLTEFKYGLVNSVVSKKIRFSENDTPSEISPIVNCLVLTED